VTCILPHVILHVHCMFHLQVPGHGVALVVQVGGDQVPRSPYEDSLAALHEIATTGNTPRHPGGEPGGGHMGSSGAAGPGGSGAARKRPRLQVQVGGWVGVGG
jgi:hypothetical protein